MHTIGLTGSIGAGKSSIARYLKQCGHRVIDADHLGHEAYLPGTPCYHRVVREFGNRVVAEDGTIDRTTLGNIVFNDLAQLQRLNEIVWPAISQLAIERLRKAEEDEVDQIVFLEAAVLIEAGWHKLVDEVWSVLADSSNVIQRVLARDGTTEQRLKRRLEAQISSKDRVRWSTVVINNDTTLENLFRTIDQQLVELRQRIKGSS